MSMRMQVVLSVFETGGSAHSADRSHTRVNVRLITATNRDLPRRSLLARFRGPLLPLECHPHRFHRCASVLAFAARRLLPPLCCRQHHVRNPRCRRPGTLLAHAGGQYPRVEERSNASCCASAGG